jgi:hypothetical protein
MTDISVTPRESSVEPLLELARCSRLHRFILAGPSSTELMVGLHSRGFTRVATTATCGLPQGQYDVGLVDWRAHSTKSLETTLYWLVHFLAPSAVLVILIDVPERTAGQKLGSMLQRLGFLVEVGTRCAHGSAIAARRRDPAQSAIAA